MGRENAATVVRCFEVCATCPVRAECLRDALSARFSAFGVWGGTTMTERRPLVRRRKDWDVAERFQAPGTDERKGIEENAQLLERTFPERMATWKRLAKEEPAKFSALRALRQTPNPSTVEQLGLSP